MKKNYRSRNVTFHEEQVTGLDNGSRPAIVLPFPGHDPVGAVNIAQTNATDAKEVLPTLEQPLSPTEELSLQLLILLKEYLQHLVLIVCKWRFKILQST